MNQQSPIGFDFIPQPQDNWLHPPGVIALTNKSPEAVRTVELFTVFHRLISRQFRLHLVLLSIPTLRAPTFGANFRLW